MHLLQADLEGTLLLWNTHKLRRGTNNCGGVPNELYMLPLLNGKPVHFVVLHRYLSSTGAHDCTNVVDSSSLSYAKEYSSIPPPPVSLEFLRVAEIVMNEHNITNMPTCTSDALQLYILLVSTLELYI